MHVFAAVDDEVPFPTPQVRRSAIKLLQGPTPLRCNKLYKSSPAHVVEALTEQTAGAI